MNKYLEKIAAEFLKEESKILNERLSREAVSAIKAKKSVNPLLQKLREDHIKYRVILDRARKIGR